MKNIDRRFIIRILLAILAGLVAAVNINSFVAAGNLVPGGFSGLSLMIIRIAKTTFNIDLNYSTIYLLFNIPCTLLVYKSIGHQFTFVSLIDVVVTSLFVEIIPIIYVTDDVLLISVFGGILGGISGALMLLADGCGGGMDFVAIYYAKKKQKSMWNTILLMNDPRFVTPEGMTAGELEGIAKAFNEEMKKQGLSVENIAILADS